ncbi:hypothetical protein P691DRAFT_759646 [Macrolepiota fuliginosa MF-IS2]|uniref:Uncharacterized protein n=1 Tax=Macrolepiota fuliginosa MF-IS2 TaxID=1400762 RepID=A0A9P5XCB0_9AGAR|nr:hypothetical protein P691DRAFT_759646 [Macrolepiota fuliginosa MF-IS2]
MPYLRVCNIWELDDDYGLHNTIDFMNNSSIRQVELQFDKGLEFCHDVPTPSGLWFRCGECIEVLKLTGPLMVAVELLIVWFTEPNFAPSLERLEIDATLWSAGEISGAGHRFEHLDQQLSDRAGISRGKVLHSTFYHCAAKDAGLGWGRVKEALSHHMWRSRRRGTLDFVPRMGSN